MWVRISSAAEPRTAPVSSRGRTAISRRRMVAPRGVIDLERTPALGSGALRSVATDVRHPLGTGAGARRVATPARLATWFRGHALGATVVASVILVLAVLHAWGLGRYPAFFDDEGTYVAQAFAINELGALTHYTYWYDHPPLGWIQLAAWLRIAPTIGAETLAVAAGRQFIVVTFVLSAFFLYAVARRLGVRRSISTFALLLFGLSPVALHYQRMVLLDNIAVMWLLAALALSLSPGRRLSAYAAAGLCLAVAVLTKETFLLFAPAVLLSVYQHAADATRRFALLIFSAVFVAAASFYPLFALLRGELFEGANHSSLMYGVKFQLNRAGGSVFDADSGPREVVEGWLRLDALILVAALALLPMLLAMRRYRVVGVGLLVPLAMLLRPDGYVPAMYVIAMIPFAALALAAVSEELAADVEGWVGHLPRLRNVTAALAAIVALAVPSAVAASSWVSAGVQQLRTNDTSASEKAIEWLSTHADRQSFILTDDSIWTDLVQRGFHPDRTVWFYKLDLDPEVPLPWSTFDYVVATNYLRGNVYWLPRTRQVFERSDIVAIFISRSERIEIRRVEGSAAGLPSERPARVDGDRRATIEATP
jgi:hypothetical protein